MEQRIEYSGGYKYQLRKDYYVDVGVFPRETIRAGFLFLSVRGLLRIKKGYAWDGPSGPTFDTRNFMRGSLVHDALYQLMREGHLGHGCRIHADELLRKMCLEDGMSAIRAWWVYVGVRWGGGPAATMAGEKPLLTAPAWGA